MSNRDKGYIKFWRSFLKWEWYDDINTKVLFLHCLLSANYEEKYWRNKLVKRGSFVTSLNKLSIETGLSVQMVRTSLNKLISTGELTKQTFQDFSIITVNNWGNFQDTNTQSTGKSTGIATSRATGVATTTKEDKEYKNIRSNNIHMFVPPTLEEVEAYVKEKGYHFEAETFIAFYESNGWKVGKNPMKNWKSACVTWEKNRTTTNTKRSTQSNNPWLEILKEEYTDESTRDQKNTSDNFIDVQYTEN